MTRDWYDDRDDKGRYRQSKPGLRLTERGFLVLVIGPVVTAGLGLMVWISESGATF